MVSGPEVNEMRNEHVDRMSGYFCTVSGGGILEDVAPAMLSDTNRLDFRGQEVLKAPGRTMLLRPPMTGRVLTLLARHVITPSSSKSSAVGSI